MKYFLILSLVFFSTGCETVHQILHDEKCISEDLKLVDCNVYKEAIRNETI